MKIESKRVYFVSGREFETRDDAKRFAEYGGYEHAIEPYLEARGFNDPETRADLTNRTRIVNVLVDYFRWAEEEAQPEQARAA
jgi:hypothetical protein